MSEVPVDQRALERIASKFAASPTSGTADMTTYLASQVSDTSHRQVSGPLRPATGASGAIWVAGHELVTWGDPTVPEMAFSVTKSVVSLVAGIAFDDGLLVPDQPVGEVVDLPEFRGNHNERILWRHLLHQSSQWEGVLWGKPTSADAQSFREGNEVHGTPPGHGWAYNDVRMNLLTYALTVLLGRSLSDVLRDRVMTQVGASDAWSWDGYLNSFVDLDGDRVEVVSGGAHWGGGLVISAIDLMRIGQLLLARGAWRGKQVVSGEWIEQSLQPCPVKPEYGYLWWLNHTQIPWPGAPRKGFSARGNGGRHLLWIDPGRDLVMTSHWTEGARELICEVSEVVGTQNCG